MFKNHFRTYLFGRCVPESPRGEQPVEPVDPAIPATVLRASTLLAAMAESVDLPVDPDYRLQVSQFTQTPFFGSHVAISLIFYFRDRNTVRFPQRIVEARCVTATE